MYRFKGLQREVEGTADAVPACLEISNRQTQTVPPLELRVGYENFAGGVDSFHGFSIDPFPKHCLLNGLDELGYTLSLAEQVTDFERRYERESPYVSPGTASSGQ